MSLPLHSLMVGDPTYVEMASCRLAKLWRLALIYINIHPTTWDSLMVSYINDAREVLTKKQADNLKGNVSKSLVRDGLAFKALCRGVTVLNYKKTIFRVYTTKGDVTHTASIAIPPTYDDEPAGRYLKALYVAITADWPEVTINWREHMRTFRERVTDTYGDDSSNLSSSISAALNSNDITWQVFYQALMIHDFDSICIELTFERRSSNIPIVVPIHITK